MKYTRKKKIKIIFKVFDFNYNQVKIQTSHFSLQWLIFLFFLFYNFLFLFLFFSLTQYLSHSLFSHIHITQLKSEQIKKKVKT